MSLVNGHEADTTRNVLHALDKTLIVQPLRGAIDHAEVTSTELLVDGLQLIDSLGRVDALSRNATLLEYIDLVLHQGDKGRHNDRDARLARCPGTLSLVDLGKGNCWNLQPPVSLESKGKRNRRSGKLLA